MARHARDFKVSYRLGDPYTEQLRAYAERCRMSEHQYARLVLVQHFERAEHLDLKAELEVIRRELRTFRAAFEDALE